MQLTKLINLMITEANIISETNLQPQITFYQNNFLWNNFKYRII